MVHRLTHPTATAEGLWTDGDPQATPAVPGTVYTADWGNMVLQELENVVLAAGLALDSGDQTQLEQAVRILATGSLGLKNLAINGGVRVWRRGSSFSVVDEELYTADRWAAIADASGGAGTATVLKQGFAPDQTDVPGGPTAFLRWQQTNAATAGQAKLVQKIEAIRETAGHELTFSLWAQADSSYSAELRIYQDFGDSESLVGSTPITIADGAWGQHTYTVTAPAIPNGQALTGRANLRVELVLTGGGVPTIDVALVQLERASQASGYEFRPLSLEHMLCERYFFSTYPDGTDPGAASTYAGASQGHDAGQRFQALATRFAVELRAAPTVVFYSPETGASGFIRHSTGADHAVTGVVDASSKSSGAPEILTFFQNDAAVFAHVTADAEL